MSKQLDPTAIVDDVIRAAAHLEPELEEALAEHRLTRPSYQVLLALAEAPEHSLTQRELSGSVRRTSGTMSVRLARLERAGYVTREPDPDDRRGVVVTLTERGQERLEAALPAYAQTAQRLLAGLADDDRDAFAAQLQRWLGFFEPADHDAPRLGIAVAPAAVAQRMRRAVGLPDRHGILVMRVKSDSAAHTAGLRRGDLVVAADGAEIRTIGDLQRAVGAAQASVTLAVVRGVEERAVEVALG